MRLVNFICYLSVTYILSSLYGIIFRLEVPEILKFANLINLSVLFLLLLIVGYLLTNFFKSLKEVFESGVKKFSYILAFICGVNTNNVALIYAISICLIGMYAVLLFKNRQIKKKIKIEEPENEQKLYPSRRNLMEVLNYALEEYSLIALDGTWGSGKTTFMDIVMRDNREKYYYIPVNVMLFENRNSLKTEFLNQLKGIFKEEGIFQGSLMDFDYYLDGVSNDWAKIAKNIIFSKSKSFKEANEKLKSEIEKIDKKIVVGVDNLERIYGESEPEWKQILGFIHELQELGIKIVVMANLEEMLTTKKETGEKDLSNHEYFDKFYEFKLKLNEVTTEEIVEQLENESLDKGWLEEQFIELNSNFNKGFKDLEKKLLKGNKSESEKQIAERQIVERQMSDYRELQWRYLDGIKNPRKIKKLMKDFKTKREKITNIFNFIDKDEYEKLIFKTSIFSIFYFDFMKDIKQRYFIDYFFHKNIFFTYLFDYRENALGGINRLLHYDSKENLIIDEIKKIISTKEINLSTIEKRLKDLEIYSSTLDPDFDQATTKEAYKIIEEKLIELEKTDKEKIHKIIKENEENICKLNYLTYPNELGVFKNIKYKFNDEVIYMMYRELEVILRPGRSRSRNELRDMLETINVYYYLKKENYYVLEMSRNVNLDEINELIEKIKEKEDILKIRKEKEVSSIYKAEDIIYDMVLNFLRIIKSNMEKQETTIVEELSLGNWEEYDFKQKENLLKILENSFEDIKELSRENSDFTLFTEVKEESDLLKSLIEKEENQTIILKLAYLIKTIEYRLVEFEIFKKVNDINMEVYSDKKISLRKKLLSFIKEKSKEERLQYMFNRQHWDGWMKEVEKIGIKEEEWTIKPQ